MGLCTLVCKGCVYNKTHLAVIFGLGVARKIEK